MTFLFPLEACLLGSLEKREANAAWVLISSPACHGQAVWLLLRCVTPESGYSAPGQPGS